MGKKLCGVCQKQSVVEGELHCAGCARTDGSSVWSRANVWILLTMLGLIPNKKLDQLLVDIYKIYNGGTESIDLNVLQIPDKEIDGIIEELETIKPKINDLGASKIALFIDYLKTRT